MTVVEYADFEIQHGLEAEFETAVAAGVGIFRKADGCLSMHLQRIIEKPNLYRLVVEWQTMEHHTNVFKNSSLIEEWRALTAPCVIGGAQVVHSNVVVQGFAQGE